MVTKKTPEQICKHLLKHGDLCLQNGRQKLYLQEHYLWSTEDSGAETEALPHYPRLITVTDSGQQAQSRPTLWHSTVLPEPLSMHFLY